MRYYVITLFPDLIGSFCEEGLLGKARRAGYIEVEAINPRRFAADKHRSIDDAPYGGGSGMVMMPGPLVDAMEHADALESERGGPRPIRVLLTPQGEPFTQSLAHELSRLPALTLVCGRYEGVDERARHRVDREISLGDFVLMGGELGALCIIEATARLRDGVLGNPESVRHESHAAGLLEHPHYTRPARFRGEGVPEVLLSGDHAKIAAWRRREAFARTVARRPDLLLGRELTDEERAWREELS